MVLHSDNGSIWASIVQVVTLTATALVSGATFGIWRGYDPAAYSASTFVEVHQGAVRGLNFLLPALALAAIVCIAILAWRARKSRSTLVWYLSAIGLMITGGLITRFVNQPINDIILGWTAAAPPAGWQSLRDTWWAWHIGRTLAAIAAMVVLIIAVLLDRTRCPD